MYKALRTAHNLSVLDNASVPYSFQWKIFCVPLIFCTGCCCGIWQPSTAVGEHQWSLLQVVECCGQYGQVRSTIVTTVLQQTVITVMAVNKFRCLRPEAKFLDGQTKVLRVFLLVIHSHLCGFALRFLFLQIHTTSFLFLTPHAMILQ